MVILHAIVTMFGALIFAMPIMFPNAKIKMTNRSGEK